MKNFILLAFIFIISNSIGQNAVERINLLAENTPLTGSANIEVLFYNNCNSCDNTQSQIIISKTIEAYKSSKRFQQDNKPNAKSYVSELSLNNIYYEIPTKPGLLNPAKGYADFTVTLKETGKSQAFFKQSFVIDATSLSETTTRADLFKLLTRNVFNDYSNQIYFLHPVVTECRAITESARNGEAKMLSVKQLSTLNPDIKYELTFFMESDISVLNNQLKIKNTIGKAKSKDFTGSEIICKITENNEKIKSILDMGEKPLALVVSEKRISSGITWTDVKEEPQIKAEVISNQTVNSIKGKGGENIFNTTLSFSNRINESDVIKREDKLMYDKITGKLINAIVVRYYENKDKIKEESEVINGKGIRGRKYYITGDLEYEFEKDPNDEWTYLKKYHLNGKVDKEEIKFKNDKFPYLYINNSEQVYEQSFYFDGVIASKKYISDGAIIYKSWYHSGTIGSFEVTKGSEKLVNRRFEENYWKSNSLTSSIVGYQYLNTSDTQTKNSLKFGDEIKIGLSEDDYSIVFNNVLYPLYDDTQMNYDTFERKVYKTQQEISVDAQKIVDNERIKQIITSEIHSYCFDTPNCGLYQFGTCPLIFKKVNNRLMLYTISYGE